MSWRRSIPFCITLLLSAQCLALHVSVPLALSDPFVESLVRQQLFPNGIKRLNDDGTGCQFLELREPRVQSEPGRVLLRARAWARAGRAFGGRCVLVLDWRGHVEFTLHPTVGEAGRSVVLSTASWRALRPDGSTATVSTTIGRWLDGFLGVDGSRIRVDLARPLDEVQRFLALATAPNEPSWRAALVASLAVEGVTAESGRVRLIIGLRAPEQPEAPPRPEPALEAAELANVTRRLDAVDAFFTYTIKSVVGDLAVGNEEALLAVLLGARYELLAILQSNERNTNDAVRALFIDTWQQLAPTLRTAAERPADPERALAYLAFIGAGDALRALDELGPAVGIDMSEDGLRRLARMLVPARDADPLTFDEAVDPEIRAALGFGSPLPAPAAAPRSSWIDWIVPRAMAAATLDPAITTRLNNWVPKPRDMDVYLPMVRDVLRHVVAEQIRDKALDSTFHSIYRTLVLAAAWQESCWRQFVAENNMRVPMVSSTGDVGMMQINPRVWRGFYDLQGLRWDIVYNARAGADILQHHLVNYGIGQGEQRRAGGTDNLARAAYAAYNGGPRQYDRYRRWFAGEREQTIDTLFYEKFRRIKGGDELAVTACYGG